MVELADTQVLGTCANAYEFESHYPHHIGIIRTFVEIGSDYLFFVVIIRKYRYYFNN